MDDVLPEERLIEAALEEIEEGLIITGPEGRILSCNQAAEQIAGVTSEQIVGQIIHKIFPLESTGIILQDILDSLNDDKPVFGTLKWSAKKNRLPRTALRSLRRHRYLPPRQGTDPRH